MVDVINFFPPETFEGFLTRKPRMRKVFVKVGLFSIDREDEFASGAVSVSVLNRTS